MIVESPLDLVCPDLDIAAGNFILETATSSNAAIALPDFFSNSARW
jgi:hypothetical protein